MAKKDSRNDNRLKRHERVRKDVFGTPERPRLCVFRSSKNIFAQVIDDVSGKTLAAASTLDKDIKEQAAYGGNKAAAKLVGEKIGEVAKNAGIKAVCFDRGGYLYHGRVKELADGARASGLEF
ncbi:MAG: 50S ribosomal protein L18 [Bacillota bacterium]|jgi:large subunit ribosomal protein L18|nr:50S ribosomal protein L18 [Eubacteriales bacterium]MDI9491577.1 50S ribosomal protein L18 [Bacillota bacterium]NLV70857.1 50S ribosomal protein L18 [Clostridiales bacterium]HPF18144.1 50S ribosomal protein L18 [Bacillota bacterium]HRV32783.1 50S ribosomal protein L18 [Anaerovoracaceae bacterium]